MGKYIDADDIVTYNRDGTRGQQMELPSDLFIITPEPELTEFEEHLKQLLDFSVTLGSPYEIDCIKSEAAELLDLANKELKKHEFAIFTREEFDAEIEKAKAEALKDLPRWKKANSLGTGQTTLVRGYVGEDDKLFRNGRVISLNDLEKLPGFKED